MKDKKKRLLITLLLATTFCATQPSVAAQSELDHHEKIIAGLRSSNDVRPPEPEVHPVAAQFNREAVIPPQCYTRTEGQYNPCYVCHQNAIEGRENVMNDGGLQVAYSFSDEGLVNHWQNLFEDRSEAVKKISDDEILEWVNQDNYSDLTARLKEAKFEGWIPDLNGLHLAEKAFDEAGFAKDGSGWVAFNYKPLPSTFWPTNGSTDDVMIRLAEDFRVNEHGEYVEDIYKANLAILEASIKSLNKISSLPIDERKIGKDLNADGKLEVIENITVVDRYVGKAEKIWLEKTIYPAGTEFLHTVRYLGVDEKNQIGISTRMKEVRYMRKWRSYLKSVYARQYQLEAYEKEAGHLPGYNRIGDHGLDNGTGWAIQGFIEARDGSLRIATHEENFFCMGCHNSIGSTIDKTFSFARKPDGAAGWGYINLKGMPDVPNKGETEGEILTYLRRVGGGGEFRSNEEMYARWFKENGEVNEDKVRAAKDVYELITPSLSRAMQLNKAYRTIVEQQDYIYGRDATVAPPKNVYDQVSNESSPTLPAEKIYAWDIRLDWLKNNITNENGFEKNHTPVILTKNN